MLGSLRRVFGRVWVLALLGGMSLSTAWVFRTVWVVPLVLLPWFALFERLAVRRVSYWYVLLVCYVSAVVWNGLSVWWIAGATVGGMLGAVFAMAACMVLALLPTHYAWREKGRGTGLLTFGVTWVAFEYFFHNSEIAWPWLTLGNSLSNGVLLAQWYEYTGVLGGSVWIIAMNACLYLLWRGWGDVRTRRVRGVVLCLVVLLPCGISLYLWEREQGQGSEDSVEVVVVQPSIDPWNDKFGGLTSEEQLGIMLHLADSAIGPSTRLVVTPETSLPASLWEHELNGSAEVEAIRGFLRVHSGAKWLTGASTLRYYPGPGAPTHTARQLRGGDGAWYDAHNAALLLDTSQMIGHAIKSKLVVGVEMLPYPQYLKVLGALSIDLGGITGSLGTEEVRRVFSVCDGVQVAPIICYESVFGEYCTEYVRRGATLLAVVTNDAWWGNTLGLRHHLAYARLRCIESRRDMVRSANTGISAKINRMGVVSDAQEWWVRSAIRVGVHPNARMTFYVLHGDYLGRVCSGMTVLLLVYLSVDLLSHRRRRGVVSG